MKRKIPIFIGLCCLIAMADVCISGQGKATDNIFFNSISKTEIEMLLADVAKTNPMVLKRLAEDPEMKKAQIENLKQLLAFASQAQKDGLADDPTNRQELDSIKAEVIAVNYDREINKSKAPMAPFDSITDAQVAAYWSEDHEAEFNDFLNAKVKLLKASSPELQNRQVTADEKAQARDVFAKTHIYKAEYDRKVKAAELSKDFIESTDLQVKLQQAQFLARLYNEKLAEQNKVTDEDIAQYIAVHPELDPSKKRSKAQGVLDRAKAGENFAELANEFTEDPGNMGADGIAQGGIYKDVPKGRMIAPFEAAALALQPGQVASELVETDFGFHIIKLERKLEAPRGSKKEPTYDVRHILIATGYKDADNPTARETPLKEYVRTKLETDKERKLLEKLIADNNIQVPDDFTIPEVTEEQIEQMRQQLQVEMPQGATGAEADGKATGTAVKKRIRVKRRPVSTKRVITKRR